MSLQTSGITSIITDALKACIKMMLSPEPCDKFVPRHQLQNIIGLYESIERREPDVIISLLSAFLMRQVARKEFSKEAASELIQTFIKIRNLVSDEKDFKTYMREFLSTLSWIHETIDKCIFDNKEFEHCIEECRRSRGRGQRERRPSFKECVHECLRRLGVNPEQLANTTDITQFSQMIITKCH